MKGQSGATGAAEANGAELAFLPFADPWQVPALHPRRDITGATSRAKSTRGFSAIPLTATGTSTERPARLTCSVALPSASGRTSPSDVTSATVFESPVRTTRVTSRVSPDARRAVT